MPFESHEHITFPYCIVEVKLRIPEPPAWIGSLVASGAVKLVLHNCQRCPETHPGGLPITAIMCMKRSQKQPLPAECHKHVDIILPRFDENEDHNLCHLISLSYLLPPLGLLTVSPAGILLPAPKFSKYLHGTAALFPDRVPRMPYWFLHDADGSMSPATWEEMADDDAAVQSEADRPCTSYLRQQASNGSI